ncbi:carbohydrate ABC transporter permease [Paenibacillus sp. P36]|uniref:carbohydrate ABC transporter permease n=1 Tax=Paenibacillus sp. P36 TaxID=3342538 RepID=UPI0038B373F4
MNRRFSIFQACNTVILALAAVSTLYPFLYMISISLSDHAHVLQGDVWLWPRGINLDMYKYVFKDGRIFTGYQNTIIYTALGTVVSLLVTSMGGYALSKKEMVFHKTFTFIVLATLFVNGGMIPTFLVVKSYGLVNTIWAMVLPGVVTTWNLIIIRTFFSGIPKELEESGKLDGLSEIGIFLRIVLPLSKAALATIGLFYAVGIWNNFMGPLLYLRKEELFPLQVFLRQIVLAGQFNGDGGAVSDSLIIAEDALKYATIMVSTLPLLVIYPFIQKYFVKGALIGSVKG